MNNTNGIVIVYKEKGWTSHDVCNKVRKIFETKKVGHTGTLDPDACGILPVCLGNATKISSYILEKEKEYIATIKFGIVTDTEDISGKVLEEKTDFALSEDEVEEAIMSFVGEYDQVPPMYSAIKINGKKLYEYARKGETVDVPARKVTIRGINILDINTANKSATFRVACTKGTYIRALCHDIGKKLGCGACMSDLIRTRSGVFDDKHAFSIERLEELKSRNELHEAVLKTDYVFSGFEKVVVNEDGYKRLSNGNTLNLNFVSGIEKIRDKQLYTVYYNDEFYALYKGVVEGDIDYLKPEKMFITNSEE